MYHNFASLFSNCWKAFLYKKISKLISKKYRVKSIGLAVLWGYFVFMPKIDNAATCIIKLHCILVYCSLIHHVSTSRRAHDWRKIKF